MIITNVLKKIKNFLAFISDFSVIDRAWSYVADQFEAQASIHRYTAFYSVFIDLYLTSNVPFVVVR